MPTKAQRKMKELNKWPNAAKRKQIKECGKNEWDRNSTKTRTTTNSCDAIRGGKSDVIRVFQHKGIHTKQRYTSWEWMRAQRGAEWLKWEQKGKSSNHVHTHFTLFRETLRTSQLSTENDLFRHWIHRTSSSALRNRKMGCVSAQGSQSANHKPSVHNTTQHNSVFALCVMFFFFFHLIRHLPLNWSTTYARLHHNNVNEQDLWNYDKLMCGAGVALGSSDGSGVECLSVCARVVIRFWCFFRWKMSDGPKWHLDATSVFLTWVCFFFLDSTLNSRT